MNDYVPEVGCVVAPHAGCDMHMSIGVVVQLITTELRIACRRRACSNPRRSPDKRQARDAGLSASDDCIE
jgi:hypothetical protein